MNYSINTRMIITQILTLFRQQKLSILVIATILSTTACSRQHLPILEPYIDPDLHQAVFQTPENAADTFTYAVKTEDEDLLRKVLGADFRKVLPLEGVKSEDVTNFLKAWDKYHTLIPNGDKKRMLAIGKEKWTLPIPIVKGPSGWYFDINEGLERMRIRRIGRNELATMQAVLAYYDAQMEYAEKDRNKDGFLEYAQKFISTPGTHDGLYWHAESGNALSPLGTLFADRSPGGGYHGYFYRILKAQGGNAKGGAYSYMLGNHLRSGFGLIAWPVEYGESGIMSFIVSHEGIVYEQNLGADSTDIAEQMTNYNPGPGWIPTKEVNASESGTK